ncbi:hypothetical protein [uncultured Tateyamaria sp.]|uniref:hypothetical protein n=1 Tax=uncultured Tateyamaria sp. TaxID=455651 RepID=UPI00261696BF|nr:hypothetical protein [uncultured Tateyamaria sp.]
MLTGIQDHLDLVPGNPSADKMLVMGHSLGGNMLAQYLRPMALCAIENHKMGTEMKPLIGDLVFLLNPAAEARKWTDLQVAMREKAQVPPTMPWVSYAPPKDRTTINVWKGMFSLAQRPTYISLTATKDWGEADGGRSEYDRATGVLFPLSRYVALQTDREEVRAIGHLTPEYTLFDPPKGGKFYRIDGAPVGTSHEFIVNEGNKKKTLYENSGDPMSAGCGSHDGWLTKALQRQKEPFKDNWDSGYSNSVAKPPLLNNMRKAELQIRHSLYAQGNHRAESVSQGASPFWNMRALDTAVYDHSGFINFVTLCGINLLWLDNATAGMK